MSKKSRKSLYVLLTLLIAVAAFIALYLYVSEEKGGESIVWEECRAEQGSQSHELFFRGILQPAREVPIVAMTKGRITEIAKQGTPVKKGDVLCIIDDTEAKENIENQETSLNTSQLSVEQNKAYYNLVEFQENNNVQQCKAKLAHAILEEKEELNTPNERDLRLMEIEEQLARLDVQDAEENYQRELRMFNKKYISASALEPYERSLENAKASLEELLLKNQITRKGITDERKVELRKAVERAQANLERVDLRRKRRLEDIQAQIDSEEKNIAVIEHSIKQSQEEIDAATIYAPTDGVFKLLAYRDWTSGGLYREIAVGDEKWRFDVIGHIIDPTEVKIRLVINEADYLCLKEGMEVSVTFPAIPGKQFKGAVSQLGAIGKDRDRIDPTIGSRGTSEVAMFSATIELTGDGTSFHPGMSALIRANVDAGEGLFIPRTAVVATDIGYAVYKKSGEDPEVIEGRFFNDMLFKVSNGLNAGDVIYIRKTVRKE